MEAVGNTEGPLYQLLKMRSTQETPKPEPCPARPHFGIKPGRKCKFCKNNGESKDQFSSHVLRNPNTGQLVCPVLRSHICEMCGATGKVIFKCLKMNFCCNFAKPFFTSFWAEQLQNISFYTWHKVNIKLREVNFVALECPFLGQNRLNVRCSRRFAVRNRKKVPNQLLVCGIRDL